MKRISPIDALLVDDDLKGVNMASYEADLADCREYATGVKTAEQGGGAGGEDGDADDVG